MKRFMRWFALLGFVIFSWMSLLGWGQSVAAATINTQPVATLVSQTRLLIAMEDSVCPEFEQKIDLNNANIVAFTDCRGFYPTLARLIVENSPYKTVEDVLSVPNLTNQQKELLKSQMKNFTLTEPTVSLERRMPPRPMMR